MALFNLYQQMEIKIEVAQIFDNLNLINSIFKNTVLEAEKAFEEENFPYCLYLLRLATSLTMLETDLEAMEDIYSLIVRIKNLA